MLEARRNPRMDDSPSRLPSYNPADASDWLEDAEDAIRHAHNQSLPQRRRRSPLERSPISHGTHLTDSGFGAFRALSVRDRITIPYSQ